MSLKDFSNVFHVGIRKKKIKVMILTNVHGIEKPW